MKIRTGHISNSSSSSFVVYSAEFDELYTLEYLAKKATNQLDTSDKMDPRAIFIEMELAEENEN